MSKVTESSASFNEPSFSSFPQNPNSPTGSVPVDVSQNITFPEEISIESLVPYIPRSRGPLEAPVPSISTPRYTMTNGFNFGVIACPPEAPVFGRRIKVPRGLLVAPEPAEFAFVREKQRELPVGPSQAIFTAGKPIKPFRKSLLLAKEPEISFADSSVSPEAVFVGTGYGRLDGGDEVIEGLEDETVGVSPGGLESAPSLTLKKPLPEEDEPHSDGASLPLLIALNTPLLAGAEFDSELALITPEIENVPSPGVRDVKPLVGTPLDCAGAGSTGNTIPTKSIFPIRKPIRQKFGGMDPSELGDRLGGTHEVVGELESGAITLKPHTVTSAVNDEDLARYLPIAIEAPLPDDDQLCSKDASLSPSPALNTLPLDTGSGSEYPLLVLECGSPFGGEGSGRPLLEAPPGVEAAGLPNSTVLEKNVSTAGGSIKQLHKHSSLLVKGLEVSSEDTLVSRETLFKAAGISGLEGAGEGVISGLGDEVVESAKAPGITTKGRTDKSSWAPAAPHDSSSEDLASSLSLALETPLPDDGDPFSEDALFTLSPALSSTLLIRTEFDADDNKHLKAPQDVVIVRFPDSPVSTEGISTAAKPVKPLCNSCAALARKQEISPTNALVSWKVMSGGAGAGGRSEADKLVDELEDQVTSIENQTVTSDISSEGLARYLSITVKIPLPEGVETCSEDASLALPPFFNAPLSIDIRLGSEYHPWTFEAASLMEAGSDNKTLLETPHGAAITRSPGGDISIGVLAGGVGDGCLEGRPDAGAWGGQEQPEEKSPHSQSQAISEPTPAAEVAPIISKETLDPKASLLDNVEPDSHSIPLTCSLALNTPLPVDTEFYTEGHLPIPNIESPLGAEDGNNLLPEPPQDVLISTSPGSAVSTEGAFSARKPAKEPDYHRALLGKEPEIMFVNPSVSTEIAFCGVGAGRLTGADEVFGEPEGGDIALKIQTVSSAIGSEGLTSSLFLALKTPLPGDDELGSEDTSLTHSLAVSIPLPVHTDTGYKSPMSILKTESSLKVDEKESLLDAYQDIRAGGSSASSLSMSDAHATGGPIKPLCHYRPPLSGESGTALDSALVSPERILSSALLTLSLALNTPLTLEDESDFESLSNLEIESPLKSEYRNKPLLEALQEATVSKSADIAISMGELLTGAVKGSLGDEGDQKPGSIDAGNEYDGVGSTPPHNHSLSTKDLNLTLKANTTTTRFPFDLPSQKKRSASKTEVYGHCKIFKNPAIIPSTCTATLGLLPSDIPMGRGVSSSTLSTEANTDPGTRGPDPALVGFGETKFEFDLTDMFVGIFKEVEVVDLALSITPSSSAGGILPWSQDFRVDEGFHGNQIPSSCVDARSEIFAATSGIEKEKNSLLRRCLRNWGNGVRVRKSVIKLFNKFSPMPVDVVE